MGSLEDISIKRLERIVDVWESTTSHPFEDAVALKRALELANMEAIPFELAQRALRILETLQAVANELKARGYGSKT